MPPSPFVPATIRRNSCAASIAFALAAAGSACTGASANDARTATAVTMLSSPTGLKAGEPYLVSTSDGRVYMSWIEATSDSGRAVRVASYDGKAWSAPATVVDRTDLFVNWADFPSIVATPSGRLVAHWLQRNGEGKYAYDVKYALSNDAGATWSTPATLHRDGLAAEHGFVSLWPVEGDSVEAAWLDGRKDAMPNEPREMQLASTRIAADGSLGSERLLDTRICDCCQTAAARTATGAVVVYRDRSSDEVRDISIVRRTASGWSEPRAVHADNWQIAACPVNGPAVDAAGDTVAVAWFTGAQDTARVRVAFSTDGGVTFGAPTRVDDGMPLGRVDVVIDGRGRAVVSWLERSDSTTALVRIRAVARDGTASEPHTVGETRSSRGSGFPRFVRHGDGLIMAWTIPDSNSVVRVAHVALGER
jgi:hypothetical protein